jgi:glutamate N-acetyltransferase/amino-acid N-acetyltransferase
VTHQSFRDGQVFVTDEDDDAVALQTRAGATVSVDKSLRHGVSGARAVAKHVGVAKDGRLDFTAVRFDRPATTAAVFTRSLCPSPAVVFDRGTVAGGEIELLSVVSKNANLFTPSAEDSVASVVRALSKEFGVPETRILVSFTGVIGVVLPTERVLAGIAGASAELSAEGFDAASEAIMTTDKRPKCASVRVGDVVVSGFAKGAGMVEPNLATMLVYLFTNAKVEKPWLDAALKRSADKTFNALSVDSDTSTSDTVALFATGDVPVAGDALADLESALTAVCLSLTRRIAREAEGATKLIEVTVRLATSSDDARHFAKKVLNSPLVKTAVFGSDPNWGRVVAAIGKPAYGSPLIAVDRKRLVIRMLGQTVYDGASTSVVDTVALAERMRASKTVPIEVVIGAPVYSATVWGSDLSTEYVLENSSYTS